MGNSAIPEKGERETTGPDASGEIVLELNSVEPNQAAARGKPEKPILRLRNRDTSVGAPTARE
jgi:hypothetical protein